MEDQNAILVKQEKERQEAVLRKQSTEELQRTMSENAMSVTEGLSLQPDLFLPGTARRSCF